MKTRYGWATFILLFSLNAIAESTASQIKACGQDSVQRSLCLIKIHDKLQEETEILDQFLIGQEALKPGGAEREMKAKLQFQIDTDKKCVKPGMTFKDFLSNKPEWNKMEECTTRRHERRLQQILLALKNPESPISTYNCQPTKALPPWLMNAKKKRGPTFNLQVRADQIAMNGIVGNYLGSKSDAIHADYAFLDNSSGFTEMSLNRKLTGSAPMDPTFVLKDGSKIQFHCQYQAQTH